MNKFTNKWTEEELKILKDASLTHNEVAEITKRNYGAVKSKRLSLNIKATTEVNYWSESEIKILVKNRNLSSAEIARKIGRTAGAVQFKRNSLNLSRLSNKFDAFEIDFIISNYGIKSVKEISNFLGRSITSINSKASALGIAKKQDYWTQEEIMFLQNNFSKKTVL